VRVIVLMFSLECREVTTRRLYPVCLDTAKSVARHRSARSAPRWSTARSEPGENGPGLSRAVASPVRPVGLSLSFSGFVARRFWWLPARYVRYPGRAGPDIRAHCVW